MSSETANVGISMFQIWTMIIGSGGLIAILGGIVFLSFRTGKIISKIDERFTQIDKKSDQFERRFDCLDKKIDNLNERIARVEGAMWRNGTGG